MVTIQEEDTRAIIKSLIRFRLDKSLTRKELADTISWNASDMGEFEELTDSHCRLGQLRLYAKGLGYNLKIQFEKIESS